MPRPDFLRDGFGTIGRPGWEEIFVPEPISMTPQTPAWWVLAAVLAGLAIWGVVRWFRHYQANRYRRAALRELGALRTGAADSDSVTALPPLLKRTALSAYPRVQVASLTGTPWVSFLARTCPAAGFDDELEMALTSLSYRGPETVSAKTAARLFDASETWIRGHRAAV